MAEKDKKETKVTANLTPDAVKVVAESMGIAGLPDDAALRLATDATYRLKHIIQVRPHHSIVCSISINTVLG